MKKILFGLGLAMMATAAHAQMAPPQVPEIDALSGLAAVAAVGGALMVVWERRRRK